MKKIIIIFILSFVLFQTVQAQKQETLLYYISKSGQIVSTKDSADHFILVLPPDTSSGQVLYPINQYFMDGKPKLTIMSSIQNVFNPIIQGTCLQFYPNGKRRTMSFYHNDIQIGYITIFYPDGKVYAVERSAGNEGNRLIECRDTAGKTLAQNGNGFWQNFDDDFKKITEQGSIVDSLKNGEWKGAIDDTGKYVCIYKNNKMISGTGYDHTGKAYPFTGDETAAKFSGKYASFGDFVAANLRYPPEDKKNGTQGKVFIQFTVERDGIVDNAKILRSPSATMKQEALRVVTASPKWKPATKFGMPVPIKYTLPIDFGLNSR